MSLLRDSQGPFVCLACYTHILSNTGCCFKLGTASPSRAESEQRQKGSTVWSPIIPCFIFKEGFKALRSQIHARLAPFTKNRYSASLLTQPHSKYRSRKLAGADTRGASASRASQGKGTTPSLSYTDKSVCECAYVCACMRVGQRLTSNVTPQEPSTLFVEMRGGVVTIRLGWLASRLTESSGFCFSSIEMIDTFHYIQLL